MSLILFVQVEAQQKNEHHMQVYQSQMLDNL